MVFEKVGLKIVQGSIVEAEIALPRPGGWALVEELKQNPQTAAIPVVVLTSRAEASVRERAEREGCAAVLVKPYTPGELAPALRHVLQDREQGRTS